MAAIGISEFTFGFAFLHEQTLDNAGDLTAAPVLPSLQAEQDLGWDAHLPTTGTDFYYQFKLSDHLTNGNAKYIQNGTYHAPYYRIALHRRDNNRQHQRLREHSELNPQTYYVAPEFNNLDVFNASFLAHQVTQNSRLIPLQACQDFNDSDQHYITYQEGNPQWLEHSEEKRHEKSYTGKDLKMLYRESHREWVTINSGFAERLFDKTSEMARRALAKEEPTRARIVPPLLRRPRQAADRREFLFRTAEILSAVLGVTLVLVGTRG